MPPDGLHLDTPDVAAYLDCILSDVKRDQIEAHLAVCSACRHEVVALSRLQRTRSSRRRWLTLIPLAAAAVVALVLFRPGDNTNSVLRGRGDADGGARLIVVVPPETVSVATHPQFLWRSAGVEASYRFTLSDSSGDVAWSSTLNDTMVRLPPTVRLRPGRTYFWYVDGLLADGRTVTSGIQQFVTKQ